MGFSPAMSGSDLECDLGFLVFEHCKDWMVSFTELCEEYRN